MSGREAAGVVSLVEEIIMHHSWDIHQSSIIYLTTYVI